MTKTSFFWKADVWIKLSQDSLVKVCWKTLANLARSCSVYNLLRWLEHQSSWIWISTSPPPPPPPCPYQSLSSYSTLPLFIGPESDHWLPLSETHLLINVVKTWLMWPWLVKMPLKTCWCCYCYWCWWRGICWQHFGRDFDAEDCSRYRSWGVVNILKLMLMMVEVMKSKLSRDSDARFGTNFEVLVRSRFWSGCLVNILMLKTFMEKPLWLAKSPGTENGVVHLKDMFYIAPMCSMHKKFGPLRKSVCPVFWGATHSNEETIPP